MLDVELFKIFFYREKKTRRQEKNCEIFSYENTISKNSFQHLHTFCHADINEWILFST